MLPPRDSGVPDASMPPHDSGVPDAGPPPCGSGETRCSLGCADLRTDPDNCGNCGRHCGADHICVMSQCHPDCIGDVIDCGGDTCVNPRFDPNNCGGCGKTCTQVELCDAGACWHVPGRDLCNGQITETFTDPLNCGMCGTACAAGQACSTGLCCDTTLTNCGGACTDTTTDRANCGHCGTACGSNQVCSASACMNCGAGQSACGNLCTDTRNDPLNCGGCGMACASGQTCTNSACVCPAVLTSCSGACVDKYSNPAHCGGCNMPCGTGQLCVAGSCVDPCPAGLTLCGNRCVDTSTEIGACGSCTIACANGQTCTSGACVACAGGPNDDCDHDGYTVADGDCCDSPGLCGARPELVNPGAVELLLNGVDDNCNGLVDSADVLDTSACDGMLSSNSLSPVDAAKALDICRQTTSGATGAMKTWGLISAEWELADGTPLTFADGHSIRPGFGAGWGPRYGSRLLVISSGIAADATQTNPGPNGGPIDEQSTEQMTLGDLSMSCDGGDCLSDWFQAANPPLKAANKLPESPVCAGAGATDPQDANDSVMLVLKLRAPTNARSFTLSGAFFSVEYPEYVCSDYNDQLVAAVTTPSPTWPQPNPPDKNLLTYRDGPLRYPVGINVAAGAGIFAVCERPGTNPACQDMYVSPNSCSAGLTLLQGTGFEKPSPTDCAQGGATRWLQVSGNVVPGQEVTLRLAIWDVGDEVLDSTALFDAFRWQPNPVTPGTE
jgi:hypothetical protein